jgi:lysophospholipid acyltransferase (LPLAT)-like uncharacterized protein
VTLTRRQHFEAAAIAAIGTPLIEALGGTYTWREQGAGRFDEILRSGRQPILALWHGRILAATLYFRDRGVIAITSRNFDGEWIARIMRRFGYGQARGSTSRGGPRALVELKREMKAGSPAAFTVDGPRGPAGVVQPGAIWLAGVTGNPILPFHIEASKYWTVKSWDRHQVPKPGSDLAIAIGEPMDVDRDLDPDRIEAGCKELQQRLVQLEVKAKDMLRAERGTRNEERGT